MVRGGGEDGEWWRLVAKLERDGVELKVDEEVEEHGEGGRKKVQVKVDTEEE